MSDRIIKALQEGDPGIRFGVSTEPMDEQKWLVRLDQYGNAKLVDGPHDTFTGVAHARTLFQHLGLDKGKNLAGAIVKVFKLLPAPPETTEEG